MGVVTNEQLLNCRDEFTHTQTSLHSIKARHDSFILEHVRTAGDTKVEATVAAGAAPQAARKWWTGELARIANSQDKDVTELEISGAHVAELTQLVDAGKLNDRLAREVLTFVLNGEGSPTEIVAARGLEVVSDDGALIAAIDAALAKQPDVLDAIREGRMQAAGAVIGAVMQAMKGSADAGRVRELLIEKANA